MNSTARIATAASAAVAATSLITTTAQAAIPNPDGPLRTHTETWIDPATGRPAPARITEYPSITVRPATLSVIEPASGTGGLFLRTPGGAIKGLLAHADQARFVGCHPSDANLVLVRQITHGNGGWGAYEGYVKVSATADPGQIPCGG
ncbi:hypothetical protein [Streptomyces noursei]|uniref:hypothetical protein n=1 Tax=Streptomyces noursei TaxID=1971 RepID=UPI001679D05B|nr:hypothetical protein [Streptomyces noursei]MCZ1021321.1 hypothetical protein [Streptomyces noursei]GGX55827.1 hypothetical protein GCM10010341_90700 [Streptomyces noursei]